MKASELRIGNIVVFNNTTNIIYGIKYSNAYYVRFAEMWLNMEDIEPILLTEELLLKFGFEEWDIKGEWVFEKVIFKDFDIEKKMIICSSGTCSLEEQENHPDVDVQKFIIRQDIKYVHQLQNLYFALTGKDLEYEQN